MSRRSRWLMCFTKARFIVGSKRGSLKNELPIDAVSGIFAGWYVEREIEKMFAFRQKKTKELLEAQSEKLAISLSP